jgi:hypothetical protein
MVNPKAAIPAVAPAVFRKSRRLVEDWLAVVVVFKERGIQATFREEYFEGQI